MFVYEDIVGFQIAMDDAECMKLVYAKDLYRKQGKHGETYGPRRYVRKLWAYEVLDPELDILSGPASLRLVDDASEVRRLQFLIR